MHLVESDRLLQHASNNIQDDAVPHPVDDATSMEMVTLKWEITAKNAISKSMQARLRASLPEVKETKKGLAITEDERDMISEQMESAVMELSATNQTFISVKSDTVPMKTIQTNSSDHIFNINMTGSPT